MVKKILGTVLLLCATCAVMASQEVKALSLEGIHAVSASESEIVETNFGKFRTRPGTEIERYDSGAVKSFYLEGKQTAKTSAGTFEVETPLNWSGTTNQPIVIYENGNLMTLYVGAHSAAGGIKKLNTPLGTISCNGRHPLQFHENGNLKSFFVAGDQGAQFLAALNPKAKFQSGREIEFYDDGNLRSFAPNVALDLNFPLGLKMKARTPIILSKSGVPIGLVPADESRLALGNGIQVSLQNGRSLEFYESGTLKEISLSYSGTGFEFYGVKFLEPEKGISSLATLKFYEGDKIKEVESPSLATEIEGKPVKVVKIKFGEDGKLAFADYGSSPVEISSSKLQGDARTGAGTEEFSTMKVWYRNGKKVAAIGRHAKNYAQRFYSSSEDCVFLFDGDKILRTIEVKSATPREVYFNGDGKPTAYLTEDMTGEQTRVEIK